MGVLDFRAEDLGFDPWSGDRSCILGKVTSHKCSCSTRRINDHYIQHFFFSCPLYDTINIGLINTIQAVINVEVSTE